MIDKKASRRNGWSIQCKILFQFLSVFVYIFAICSGLIVSIMAGIGWMSIKTGSFILVNALFLIFISRIDTIAEISFGPLRAKMHETINEAEDALARLRTITQIIAKMAIAKTMMSNFWMMNLPLRQQFLVHDNLLENMKELGLSNNEIEDADAVWKAGIKMMYVNIICKTLQNDETNDAASQDQKNHRLDLVNQINAGFDKNTLHVMQPSTIRSIIEKSSMMNKEISDWIDDYKIYCDTGLISRREEFLLKN